MSVNAAINVKEDKMGLAFSAEPYYSRASAV
jgi:hypothetical protein